MLRAGQVDILGPPGDEIAQVVGEAMDLAIIVGTVAASGGAGIACDVAPSEDLGLGQVLDPSDPFGRIGQVFSGSWPGDALRQVHAYRGVTANRPPSHDQHPAVVLQSRPLCMVGAKFVFGHRDLIIEHRDRLSPREHAASRRC
jgi:hypothetical protein